MPDESEIRCAWNRRVSGTALTYYDQRGTSTDDRIFQVLILKHAQSRVLGKLLGVVGRALAFEHDRIALDPHRQLPDSARQPRFDSLADGDRQLPVPLGPIVWFGAAAPRPIQRCRPATAGLPWEADRRRRAARPESRASTVAPPDSDGAEVGGASED